MPRSRDWSKALPIMYARAANGESLAEIGRTYGVTRERVRQLLKQYAPELTRELRGVQVTRRKAEQAKRSFYLEKLGRETLQLGLVSPKERAAYRKFAAKRSNAANHGVPWNLRFSDIEIPDTCPVFGIPLDWESTRLQDASPSFDRIDNTKGYEPGNVHVISMKANRIKCQGSLEELEKLVAYLKKRAKSA